MSATQDNRIRRLDKGMRVLVEIDGTKHAGTAYDADHVDLDTRLEDESKHPWPEPDVYGRERRVVTPASKCTLMTPAEAIDRMQCPHCGKSLEAEQTSKVATV